MNMRRWFTAISAITPGRCTVNGQRMLIGVLIVALLLALAVGMTQAQGPAPDDDTPAEDEPGAAMDDVIPIQGRLTDASGNPLNGNYNITARIYDVASGGTVRCWDTDTVAVTNGLFTMNVDSCAPGNINGDQLYLGISVGTDAEMTPRQPIFASPYAWTVRPGAIIKGARSYLFVPGSAFVKDKDSDTTRWDIRGAAARIWRGSTGGNKYIYIPIAIPGVLYGQPVRILTITVYYLCQNGTNNYIDETVLFKYDQTDPDLYKKLVDDAGNRQSNTATSYTLPTNGDYNTLSTDQGLLTLRLYLNFVNDTEYIHIGGVLLLLEHNY